jgi:hypothetical protein
MKIANKVINMIGFSMVIFSLSLANAGGSVGNGGGASSGLSMKFSGVGGGLSSGNAQLFALSKNNNWARLALHKNGILNISEVEYNKLSPNAKGAFEQSIRQQKASGFDAGWVSAAESSK